ncbi:MAG: hypothetical protein C0490_06735 [Marivirga sp.]|nr:hypothetical protein [Marivirga sp.]
MKGLSMGDWSLIARYLKKETNPGDADHLQLLADRYPNFMEELELMDGRMRDTTHTDADSFDADQAFDKLNKRFQRENLIE